MNIQIGAVVIIITAIVLGSVAYFWSTELGQKPAGISTPTGLTITTPGAGQVKLDWGDNPENDLDHYNVYRATSSGFKCDDSTFLDNTISSEYLDTGLEENITYYYRATAINNDGNESSPTPSTEVTVIPSEKPPTAEFTYSPTSPKSKNPVTFDASNSHDPDGDIVSYEWVVGKYGASETGKTPEHTYDFSDIYPVTLTVTDDDGLTDNLTKELKVVGTRYDPPVASFTFSPSSPGVGENVTFKNGSQLNYPSGYFANIRWDFGDDDIYTTTYVGRVNHSYSSPGDYEVTLTVVQNDYQTDNMTKTVTVSQTGSGR